mmetsp:Transcript_109226/g.348675  ORF Transcript_109226/g.348675 Transcript_109226/m.348675 type:complete len:209 (+) Transcript_109226:3544-4170(+)
MLPLSTCLEGWTCRPACFTTTRRCSSWPPLCTARPPRPRVPMPQGGQMVGTHWTVSWRACWRTRTHDAPTTSHRLAKPSSGETFQRHPGELSGLCKAQRAWPWRQLVQSRPMRASSSATPPVPEKPIRRRWKHARHALGLGTPTPQWQSPGSACGPTGIRRATRVNCASGCSMLGASSCAVSLGDLHLGGYHLLRRRRVSQDHAGNGC